MTDQRERNTEKSEMRVMWIMTAVNCADHPWADGHEYAHSPRLDARSVAAEVTQQANDAGRTASSSAYGFRVAWTGSQSR
jgi:hypothetical protein